MAEAMEMWAIVGLAFLGTVIWRALGVAVGDKIPPGSLFSEWINAVAYAMVSGVMMMIIFYPTGLVAETALSWRLIALFSALAVMVITGKMYLAVLAGVTSFGLALSFLG